jgi:hypothetical protein
MLGAREDRGAIRWAEVLRNRLPPLRNHSVIGTGATKERSGEIFPCQVTPAGPNTAGTTLLS